MYTLLFGGRYTRKLMNEIRLKAHAKINLGLDVLRRREDGYHEVKMVMQSLSLHDEIRIRKSRRPGIRISCDHAGVPTDGRNLVYKAAALLMEEFSITEGVDLMIRKRIPMAAGMAGGSSDGAATLVGINQLFQLGLSQKELMERGVTLGADIPFCIMRGTALSEGIGEILTKLPGMPSCYIVVAKPPIDVSTKFVYTNLKLNELTDHPDIDGMVEALDRKDLEGITTRLANVLETVTLPAYPVITELKDIMKTEGAQGSLMTGSGSTVFGIFTDEAKAKHCAYKILSKCYTKECFVTTPYSPAQ